MVKTENKEWTSELILLTVVSPSIKWGRCLFSSQGYGEPQVKQHRRKWSVLLWNCKTQERMGTLGGRKRFGAGKTIKNRMRTQVGRDQERALGEGWEDTGGRGSGSLGRREK